MAVYAIGDVQGCYTSLRTLLRKIGFKPAKDRLWFTGDLVNRGPQSADVLRFVSDLGDRATTVLGNHDLHLLAVAAGAAPMFGRDTFEELLNVEDSKYLLTWLAQRPLFYHDPEIGCSLVHAGLLPQWSIADACSYAREVERVIANTSSKEFFKEMYGDMPNLWDDSLVGWDRVRAAINAFTRLRFCKLDGTMDFLHKGAPGSQPSGLVPWFQVPSRRHKGAYIVFGHWSLLGLWDDNDVIGLDTGCGWGRALTALRIVGGKKEFISVDCCA